MAFTDNSVNSGSSGNSDNSDTTKDHMIQAGSCCPTEPKLELQDNWVLTWVPFGSMIQPESCDPSL